MTNRRQCRASVASSTRWHNIGSRSIGHLMNTQPASRVNYEIRDDYKPQDLQGARRDGSPNEPNWITRLAPSQISKTCFGPNRNHLEPSNSEILNSSAPSISKISWKKPGNIRCGYEVSGEPIQYYNGLPFSFSISIFFNLPADNSEKTFSCRIKHAGA